MHNKKKDMRKKENTHIPQFKTTSDSRNKDLDYIRFNFSLHKVQVLRQQNRVQHLTRSTKKKKQ